MSLVTLLKLRMFRDFGGEKIEKVNVSKIFSLSSDMIALITTKYNEWHS